MSKSLYVKMIAVALPLIVTFFILSREQFNPIYIGVLIIIFGVLIIAGMVFRKSESTAGSAESKEAR